MKHRAFSSVAFAAVALAVAFGEPNGASPSRSAAFAAGTPAPDGILAKGHINRVVVIVMENRTFDNLFGGDGIPGHPSPYPHADAVVPQPIATLMKIHDFAPDSGENNWHNQWQCLALGKFTAPRWIELSHHVPIGCAGYPNVSVIRPFKYVSQILRAPYWQIARRYELGDAFFAVSSTESFPAHQYIVAGQSVDDDGDTVAGQPSYTAGGSARGCIDLGSSPTPSVNVPRLNGIGWAPYVTRGIDGECWNPSTFADQLTGAQVKWQHYSTSDDPANVFNGFININGKHGQHWYEHNFPLSGDNVLTVAKNGGLPQFSWIKPPCVPSSDHPNTGNNGPRWVQTIVNAIGSNKQQWEHVAIFVIWDDWGGFYDHRTPPPTRHFDRLGPGLRTPFLVISPYVVPGTVAHGVAGYGSILRFVEELYSVPTLGRVDAESPDLIGYFDFSQKPLDFTPIHAAPPWTSATGCVSQFPPLTRD